MNLKERRRERRRRRRRKKDDVHDKQRENEGRGRMNDYRGMREEGGASERVRKKRRKAKTMRGQKIKNAN